MKLNHVLVRASDLDATNRFFSEIIGLDKGERPPFPFKGAWFYSEGSPLVHVAEDHEANLGTGGPMAHLAFEGANYDTLIRRLKTAQTQYSEKDVPLSGERQIFVCGPDGLTVEMLFPLGVSHDDGRPYA